MDPLKVPAPQETKLHFLDYWRIIRIRKTVILAVFLLVVITATLVTFILPESFSSTTRIKIERDVTDVPGMSDRPAMPGYDPYFIQTEFEVIQSELILGKVITELDLNKEWGKKYAGGETLKTTETMAVLKSRLDLRPVRNTELIEIRVFSERPEEAAKIANAIAEALAILAASSGRSLNTRISMSSVLRTGRRSRRLFSTAIVSVVLSVSPPAYFLPHSLLRSSSVMTLPRMSSD